MPVDVHHSAWDCTLEPLKGVPALRLGLRMLKGMSREGGERLVQARVCRAFADVPDLARRTSLNRADLKALAAGDALLGLSGHRHLAAWEVAGVEAPMDLFDQPRFHEQAPALVAPGEA